MSIEFECTNLFDYDQSLQRYTRCGEKIVVAANMGGQRVQCPKCGQMAEVPSIGADQSARKPAGAQASAGRTAASSDSSAEPELRLLDPIERPAVDVMTQEFNDKQHSQIHHAEQERCPKCGSPLDDLGHCTACRYVKSVHEAATLPLDQLKLQPAGFQLWFFNMISEGMPVVVIFMTIHLLVLLFTASMVTLSYFISMPFSAVIAIGSVAFAMLYAAFVFKGYQIGRNPRARLAWFQRIAWNGILAISRSLNWQGYDSSLQGRLVINLRGQGVTDTSLLEVEGLKKCSVLDLEGTLVTDKTLPELYELKYLQCVVLLRTQVSHEAVLRLQQVHPRLWIWH